MIILDTDHSIAILLQKLDLGNHVAPEDELFITSITISELTHGADRSKKEKIIWLDWNSCSLRLPFCPSMKWRYGGYEEMYKRLSAKTRDA